MGQIQLQYNPQAADVLRGEMIAIGYSESKISVSKISDMINQGRLPIKPSPLSSPINAIKLQNDGLKVAVGSSDGRLHITLINYKNGQNEFNPKDEVLFKAQKDEGKEKT